MSNDAVACSSCFTGASNEPVAKAITWAIIFLLGIVGGVLGGIIVFMIYLARKSRQYARSQTVEISELSNLDLSEVEPLLKERQNSSFVLKGSNVSFKKQERRFGPSDSNYSL